MTNKIRIGGVPEHFNYLFKLAKDLGLYKKYNVDVEFIIQSCGTGAMIKSLKDNELDVIIALTEGLVTDIAKGSDIKLFGTYVNSPLCWAASAGNDSNLNSINDLKGKTFGVSRYGSGSHLMAYVLAIQNNWNLDNDLNFKVVGNFEKLRNSINNKETDGFLWETFTTKPYHDSGEVKRIGDITTPWPCFMMASLNNSLKDKSELIKSAFQAVNEAAYIFKNDKNMPTIIAKEYNLKYEDAKTWYNNVDIISNHNISKKALETTLVTLKQTGILNKDNKTTINDLVSIDIVNLTN